MTKDDMQKIMLEVKENNAKLQKCSLHDFSIDITPDRKIDKRYRCKECGGEVSAAAKRWYELGVKHGIRLMNGGK